MKTRRNHLIGSLSVAALIAGIAAPTTQAGHEEYGVRCALALTQHRADAAAICARSAKTAAPNVTVVQPSGFDWGDAGVGAAGALGLVALAGGMGVLIATRESVLSRA